MANAPPSADSSVEPEEVTSWLANAEIRHIVEISSGGKYFFSGAERRGSFMWSWGSRRRFGSNVSGGRKMFEVGRRDLKSVAEGAVKLAG